MQSANKIITQKKNIFPLLVINFVGSLGFSIVIPFLVFIIIQFKGNAFLYGIIGAVYSAFQLIGAPLLGKWSDVYGRKKILLYSSIINVASWGIFLFAFSLPIMDLAEINLGSFGIIIITLPLVVLFIARAVNGFSGGNISVANAYVADVTADNERKANYGKMAVSQNLGFVIGPALAGILGSTVLGNSLPIMVTLTISIITLLLIIFYLPEIKREHKISEHNEKITAKKIFQIRFMPFLLVLYFLIFLGFNFFYTAFPVHVVKAMNWSTAQMGIFFAGLSLGLVVIQGPVLSFLSKKVSDSVLIIIGNLILGANFILLYTNDNVLYYIAGGFFAIGNGLMWPSFLSLLSKAAVKEYQGAVQGFASSMGSLASIIGLVLGGVLYEGFGSGTFIIAAVIIYIVFFLSFRLIKVERECGFNLTSLSDKRV